MIYLKKIAVIQDLSGLGKCSLTAAIPVISVMGVQAVPLPTAVLSNQTGYPSYYCDDYTEHMGQIMDEWEKRGFSPDGIYTGFLADEEQADKILDFLRRFRKEKTMVLVDPVMGDNGSAYGIYTEGLRERMIQLVRSAQVITPNLTEAAFLLGCSYDQLPQEEAGLRKLAEELGLNGRRSVVLTGVSLSPGKTGAMCFDAKSGCTQAVQVDFIAHPLLGTGDIFASVLTGALVQGETLFAAAAQAAEFVRACAVHTVAQNLPLREGVDFEPMLGLLTGQPSI